MARDCCCDRSAYRAISSYENLEFVDDVAVIVPEAKTIEFKGHAPVIQFSSPSSYCLDSEPTVCVEVIRVGNLDGTSEVNYRTEDGSAIDGINYGAKKGRLRFEPSEHLKEIKIPIGEFNDSFWNPMLEFKVVLLKDNLVGGTLDENLYQAIVHKIDTSNFPSDTLKDVRLNMVSPFNILFELCRMFWKMPVIRKGSLWCMGVDLVHNLLYCMHLFLYVYYINYIIRVDKDLYLVKDRKTSLVLYASIHMLSILLLHILDYSKLQSKVVGRARIFLQSAVIEKYLNYSQLARAHINDGDILTAINRDAPMLAKNGYLGLQRVAKECMQFLFMILFKLVSPVVFHSEWDVAMLVPLLALPFVFQLFLCVREPIFRVALQRASDAEDSVANTLSQILGCSLYFDYDRRWFAKMKAEEQFGSFNTRSRESKEILLNTRYFSLWVTCGLISGYLYFGGMGVIDGSVTVGMLIANINILKDCGNACGNVFKEIILIQRSFPAILNIFELLNLETQGTFRWHLQCRSRQGRTAREQPANGTVFEDDMPIQIDMYDNFEFFYHDIKVGLNFQGKLKLKQGELVAIVGAGGSGKTTFLRLVGGTLLPDMEKLQDKLGICIPSHLRTITISSEAVFYAGTLFDNITFGCAHQSKGEETDRKRVLEIFGELGMSEKVTEYMDRSANWGEIFSEAECKILNIARAMYFNAEISCFHKPLQTLDIRQMPRIMDVLHQHIENKGIALEPDTSDRRRPRTVFVTSSNPVAVKEATTIYRLSLDEGIQWVSHEMAHQMLSRYTVAMLTQEVQRKTEANQSLMENGYDDVGEIVKRVSEHFAEFEKSRSPRGGKSSAE